MMMEEEEAEPREETPPTEVTNGNDDCNHADDDITSCPSEASPDVSNMDTEPQDEVTSQKAGSEPVVVHGNNNNPANETLQRVRKWSVTKYKVTKQALSERMGRGSRTVDLDLERGLVLLRDDSDRYGNVTRLAQLLANQTAAFSATQSSLGDAFADLSVKTPSLHEEFGANAAAQRFVSKNGETLTAAILDFSSDMNTLVNKTIEDTLISARKYEAVRMEYDAYRVELEELNLEPRDVITVPKLQLAESHFLVQKEKFQRIREDLSVKVKLLGENRVKVLQNRLFVLLSSVANHSAACHHFLEQNSWWNAGDGRHGNTASVTDDNSITSWLEESS